MQNPPNCGESKTGEARDNLVSVDFSNPRRGSKKNTSDAEISVSTAQKRQVFEEFLESGVVLVAFDPRTPSTEIPSRFRGLSDLRLNFSYAYGIDDFRHDRDGIRATLMFPEGYFCCFVPWDSVFSIQSELMQKGSLWPDALPKELKVAIERPKAPARTNPKIKRAHLKLVKNSDDESAITDE